MWANSTLICFTQVFEERRKANVYDLHSDAIEWGVLSVIRLNEDDTTSSSRIFIKILFQVQKIIVRSWLKSIWCLLQELAEFMGLAKLVARTRDATLQMCWEGLLPRDNPRDTR